MTTEEPLHESAPLARAWSEQYCDGCDWYHGAWQYLRLAGVISGMKAEAGFFQAVFRDLANADGSARVLIAGSADSGMLAQVIGGYRAAGIDPEITVVDHCETPLRVNQWFARRCGIEPTVCRGDVLTFDSADPFDVICTHSFFSFVPPDRHVDLVRRWHTVLRPGGHVVTSQSVRPNYPEDRIRFTAEQAEAFGARAATAGASIDAPMRELATRFARHKSGFVVRGEDALRTAFAEGGFSLVHCAAADTDSQREHRAANPDGRDSWSRIQVVAQR